MQINFVVNGRHLNLNHASSCVHQLIVLIYTYNGYRSFHHAVTNTGRPNNAVIVGAACTGVAVTAVCIFITLSISCYVNHKNKGRGAIQVGAGSPTESRAQTPLPYTEFVPAAHLYDTLAPKSLPLTMKESKDAEYQVVVLCRNEAYGI